MPPLSPGRIPAFAIGRHGSGCICVACGRATRTVLRVAVGCRYARTMRWVFVGLVLRMNRAHADRWLGSYRCERSVNEVRTLLNAEGRPASGTAFR